MDGNVDHPLVQQLKRGMLAVVVIFVLLGIYAALMNMPVVTGCLNNECQLQHGGRFGTADAPE